MIALWLGAALALPLYTFNEDDGGLIASGDRDQWEWGAVRSGPGDGGDSEAAWATVLDGPYRQDGVDSLRLPEGPLPAIPLTLRLRHWYAIDDSGADEAAVEQLIDGAWVPLPAAYAPNAVFSGRSEGWVTDYFTLLGPVDQSELRLRFVADATVAEAGWYIDELEIVEGDPVPPHILSWTAPTRTQDVEGPYPVVIRATDNKAISRVWLSYSEDGGPTFEATASEQADGSYLGELPRADPGSTLRYEVRVSDGTNEASSDPSTLSVFLPAPDNLSCPEGRDSAAAIALSWSPPETAHAIVDYTVARNGEALAHTTETAILLPTGEAGDRLSLSARFSTSQGLFSGESVDCAVQVSAPAVVSLEPATGFPGETVTVALIAKGLLMSAQGLRLSGAPSLRLLEAEIDTVDEARLRLAIAADAPAGTERGWLCSAQACASLEFTLKAASDRPRLLTVEPSSLSQGQRAELRLRSNTPWGDGPFQVELGEGLVVEALRAEADTLVLDVMALSDAPIGLRPLRVDDGARLREGAALRLRDADLATTQGCHTAAGSPTPAIAWLALLVLRPRRRRPASS
jgi:hypothetical protein